MDIESDERTKVVPSATPPRHHEETRIVLPVINFEPHSLQTIREFPTK